MGTPAVERRRGPRHPIQQRCLVRPPGSALPDAWRCIAFNISASGIGLTLPLPLGPGTVLDIEPCDRPGARPVRARVAHTRRLEFLWLAGCELVRPLSAAELHAWLVGTPVTRSE
jgi:hypothetical protein